MEMSESKSKKKKLNGTQLHTSTLGPHDTQLHTSTLGPHNAHLHTSTLGPHHTQLHSALSLDGQFSVS